MVRITVIQSIEKLYKRLILLLADQSILVASLHNPFFPFFLLFKSSFLKLFKFQSHFNLGVDPFWNIHPFDLLSI